MGSEKFPQHAFHGFVVGSTHFQCKNNFEHLLILRNFALCNHRKFGQETL